jgi:hypothetical protein
MNTEQPNPQKERIVPTHFIEVTASNKHEPSENYVCKNWGCWSIGDLEDNLSYTEGKETMQTVAIFKIKEK